MVHASAARATTVVRAKAAAACCATARVDYHIDTYFEDTGHDVLYLRRTRRTLYIAPFPFATYRPPHLSSKYRISVSCGLSRIT